MNWSELVEDFQNGYSITKLTQKYNAKYRDINNYLIDAKVKKVRHTKIANSKIEKCINMIESGNPLSEISEKLKIDTETIRSICSENDLKLSPWKYKRSKKNENFVDDYFKNIDTEEKAYFLGLIYSDGNVREHNGGHFLNLELLREDRYILEKLANELKCGNKIQDRDRITPFGESRTSSFTSCSSEKMFDNLQTFNIVPDKSHEASSFKNVEKLIPENLIRHFLRGLIDGDGTISKRFSTTQNSIAIYQNTIEFCNDFDKLLRISMNDDSLFENIIVNKKNGVYNLRYRRIKDVIKICNHLYNDASVYLERKYKLAQLYFTN